MSASLDGWFGTTLSGTSMAAPHVSGALHQHACSQPSRRFVSKQLLPPQPAGPLQATTKAFCACCSCTVSAPHCTSSHALMLQQPQDFKFAAYTCQMCSVQPVHLVRTSPHAQRTPCGLCRPSHATSLQTNAHSWLTRVYSCFACMHLPAFGCRTGLAARLWGSGACNSARQCANMLIQQGQSNTVNERRGSSNKFAWLPPRT